MLSKPQNFDSKLPRKIVKLVCDFQKIVSYRGILVLMRSGPQLLQKIKPIRKFFGTFCPPYFFKYIHDL